MLLSTMIVEVRRALGRPPEAILDDSDVLMEIWGVTTFYRSKLRMTRESWSIGRWPLVVPASATEANIDLGDFSSAIMIKTTDPSNPYHMPRMVDIVKPEEMSAYWSGPDNLPIGGGWAHPHVAACFSIFNEAGQWKIAWLPQHNQSCVYTMWYSTGPNTVPPIFDDTSLMPIAEQDFLIIANTAINLFGQIAHPEKGLNARQKLLAQTQLQKMQQWGPLFEEARWDGFSREPRQHRKIFGENREGRIGRGY